MKQYRTCDEQSINLGVSICPLVPDRIRKIILTPKNMVIGLADFAKEKLEQMAYAERPNRIYPIGPIAEYEPSGGEPQTSKLGYGPTQMNGYSDFSQKWTLCNFDFNIASNVAKLEKTSMGVLFVDENNIIYGQRCADASEKTLKGFVATITTPVSLFPTSSEKPKTQINILFDDAKKLLTDIETVICDFDVIETLNSLVWVDVIKEGESGYKVLEHEGRLDLTPIFGNLLGASTAWDNATAVTYSSDTGLLTLTPTAGKTPSLKSPSELFTAGIKGIEQWK